MELYKWQKVTLVIILMLLLALIIINVFYDSSNVESSINIYSGKCDVRQNETFMRFMKKHKIGLSDKNWSIYIPCSYDLIEQEISIAPYKSNAAYFLIDGIDCMTAKNMLWVNLVSFHGYNKASLLSPQTYLLYDEKDFNRFKNNFQNGKNYIMKKNIQRQQGLKITNSLTEIVNNKSEYVIVQDLLENPYMIKGRKINLRVYVCIVTYKDDYYCGMYNDGFMYYTKRPYNKNVTSDDCHITSGYVDRWIYDVHPLTHTDFKKYLDDQTRQMTKQEKNINMLGQISNIVFDRIKKMLSEVFICFRGKINRNGTRLYNNLCYQLMGVDVALDNELIPMIIEINKGPDLSPKDERDGKLKEELLSDIHKFARIIPGECHNFLRIV